MSATGRPAATVRVFGKYLIFIDRSMMTARIWVLKSNYHRQEKINSCAGRALLIQATKIDPITVMPANSEQFILNIYIYIYDDLVIQLPELGRKLSTLLSFPTRSRIISNFE